MPIHIIIIAIIAIVSIVGFNNPQFLNKYMFNAYQVMHRHQYYRLITHGFLHANWTHLLVNVFVLWSFGGGLLDYFDQAFPGRSTFLFILLFFSSLVISSLYSLTKEKNNHHYNALGASGAVSAILFASIFFNPLGKVYLYAVLGIPGILFGIIYLIFERYSMGKGNDNIGHDAHFYGAVYGLLFPVVINPNLIFHFFHQLTSF